VRALFWDDRIDSFKQFMNDFLSSIDVAERFSVTVARVSQWASAGLIQYSRLNGDRGPYLFDPAEVDKFALELADRRQRQGFYLPGTHTVSNGLESQGISEAEAKRRFDAADPYKGVTGSCYFFSLDEPAKAVKEEPAQ
jgi:hypothetical protein